MGNYEVRALPLYTKDHTWAKKSGGTVIVGVTDYAQQMLKEVNFANLPDEGDNVTQMESFGELESTKAVSDLCAPFSGTVASVNEEAMDDPNMINNDPYDAGWLIEIDPSDYDGEKANLMTADQYKEYLESL